MTQAEQFLKQIALFDKCAPEDVRRLAVDARRHSYRKGDTVLFQGMISHQIFFIASGRVSVFARRERETRRVASLEEGDYFGEISLLAGKAATATVKADADETQLYILDRDVVVEALSRSPEALADVARKVRERNQNRPDAFQQDEERASTTA